MHHQVKFVFILIIWPMNFTVLSWLKDHLGCGLVNVCVLTLLHTTHKQQEESFQVIGQMRRITSSVWLTHGPRPFRKSRHVLEPWVIGRSLAHHHSLSVASFVFIFGLLHSSPDDDIDLPPLLFFFVEEFWSVKKWIYTIIHTSLDRPWSNIILQYNHSSEIWVVCAQHNALEKHALNFFIFYVQQNLHVVYKTREFIR